MKFPGTIAFLVVTIGALLLFVAVASDNVMSSGRRPPKTSYLRSDSPRKLYNYSNSGNYANNNNNGGNYGGSYANDNSGGNYGGNYDSSNYNNDDGNSNYNTDDGNSNYNTDDASSSSSSSYATDDAASSYYYNSNYNSNGNADGSSYNGRNQYYGGESVQTYTDDEEPQVYDTEYEEDNRWEILGQYGGLSGAETLAVAGLAVVVSLSLCMLLVLVFGLNVFDLCTQDTKDLEPLDEDGFVKLDN